MKKWKEYARRLQAGEDFKVSELEAAEMLEVRALELMREASQMLEQACRLRVREEEREIASQPQD